MASIVQHPKSSLRVTLSSFISRLRSKRRSRGSERDTRPPLTQVPLPLVLPQHQHTLPQLGWATITFPNAKSQPTSPPGSESASEIPAPTSHPLQTAYQDLFTAAQQFFDLADEEKLRWKHKLGSEEGWSKIEGEKEFITLRTLEYTPDVLKGPAKLYWDLMGAHLSSTLGRISSSLGLSDDESQGLRRFIGPCATMGASEADKTSTMLRIFRYEGWDAKVVAEPHADLGLLSCVVGDVPGLEVWNGRGWFDVERQYGGSEATFLVGRQLERYSNGRYPAGGHRVVSYGGAAIPTSTPHQESVSNDVEASPKRYRHSIVFVLRAHEPVIVNSSELETPITGTWAHPVQNTTAGEMYEQIRRAHFNINIGKEEREKQRLKVQSAKGKGSG